ncbi:MAG: hypothetical protein ACE5G2_01890, partial [Candidatus Krumholzibacteriia bacterium]
EPLAGVAAASSAPDAAPAAPSPDGDGPQADSRTTAALEGASVRYTISGGDIAAREFGAPEAGEVLVGLGKSALVVVAFVSYATFPLLVALADHEHAGAFLRVGITGVRMDTSYNLGQKLRIDGVIQYHEHTRALERVLCKRLELMLRAHEERLRAGAE